MVHLKISLSILNISSLAFPLFAAETLFFRIIIKTAANI